MKLMISKGCIAVIVLSLGLTGCGMDNMTPTQQALLAGSAAAAVGGIAYGIHKKHEADKEKHKKDNNNDDDDHYDNSRHAHRRNNDQCYDRYGDWRC